MTTVDTMNQRVARVGRTGRVTWWHIARAPEYFRRFLARSLAGTGRFVRVWWWWQSDQEGADQMIVAKQIAGSTRSGLNHMTIARHDHRRSVLTRSAITFVALVSLAVAVRWVQTEGGDVALVAGVWLWLIATAAIGPGRPAPIFDTPAAEVDVVGATGAGIERALKASGHSVLNRLYREADRLSEGDRSLWRSPIPAFDVVENGDGVRSAQIRLPDGVTVAELQKTADRITGAMGKPDGLVWLEQGRHASDLRLTVLPRPLHEMPQRPWPHRTSAVDPFRGITVGWGPTGRPIVVDPLFSSHKLGGQPNTGKSNAMRIMAAGTATFPSRLLFFNLKGNADFAPFKPIAHAWRTGDDPEDLAALAYWVDWTVSWIRDANQKMMALDWSEVPDQAVTPSLLSAPEWAPPRLFIDEVNLALNARDETSDRIAAGLHYIVEKGRSVGAGVTMATQRWESSNVPTDVAASVQTSIAFATANHVETGVILGTKWTGPAPHSFGDDDEAATPGLSAVRGVSGGQICHWAHLDLPSTAEVVDRVSEARNKAGLLSGQAVGQDETPDMAEDTFAGRVRTVAGELSGSFVSTADLSEALSRGWPDIYGDWSAAKVSQRVRRHGGHKTKDGAIRGFTVDSLRALSDGEVT